MEPKQIDLYEFLVESELQHYYNAFKNELKITNASQFKYATDEDLKQIGLSRPEIRRLRKFHEKYFPHGYISKLKRFLQAPTVKKDELPTTGNALTSVEPNNTYSPKPVPNNKHIIPADAICVNKQLGTGEFGIVQQGVWTNGNDRIQVAIKCLCRERMQSNPMEFLKEASIMHSIEHENIVRLYGVVLATDSLMLVTELAHLRSLLECLKDSGLRVSFLTVPTLCEFAMQICNGMMYLENKRLIHRDLAARNILVFSKNKVKISDFGLSRALGVGKDYYKTNFNVNLKLPIAWCAPECINYLRFTNSSDVWAFGVSLWEMFSYGFQPWAALTGLQILEAIDEPNYQRLEQPECCPKEYYNLMLKCWQHDPAKRPKFSEIYQMLPDIKPEQLKTVANHCEPKKDHLMYRQGEIITVLDRNTNSQFWKGVLNSGKTGYFNPTNTVAHLEGLPSSNRFSTDGDTLCRSGSERCSKRKLRTEMISKPQDDFKHTGHVGIDGASFGDIAFLANPQNYNHLPRQVVTPYKPSEDIEQTPLLLPPTPTSPDSLQTASGYFSEENPISSTNPTFHNSIEENTTRKPHHSAFGTFDFSSKKSMLNSLNPFASENVTSRNSTSSFAMQNNNYGLEASAFTNANLEDDSFNEPQYNLHHNHQEQTYGLNNWTGKKLNSISDQETQHEYHEISDDEITTENVFDLGPSLLDEINSMFGSINGTQEDNASNFFEFDHTNKKNEITELNSKHNRKNSTSDTNGNKSKKKNSSGIVKQISVKDEKILNHAIEIANEISARSMTDLVSENTSVAHSPKRKFSFRFPNLSHHSNDKDIPTANGSSSGTLSYSKEKKNFTEELKSIPDLQRFRSLSEIEKFNSDIRIPLFDKKSADFCFEKSREILTRPINIDLQTRRQTLSSHVDTPENFNQMNKDLVDENLLDIENTLKALNLDFLQTFNNLDNKTDSAETLFSEQVSQIVSTLEASARNDEQFYDNNYFEKQLQYTNSKLDKFDEKRSITPDTGFASRETNLSLSRRSIQKGGSFSPQDSFFSPRDSSLHSSSVESRGYMHLKSEPGSAKSTKSNFSSSPVKTFNNSNNSIYSHHMHNSSIAIDNSNSRQRSMSFTDNYNLRSPIHCEPQQREYQSGGSFRNKSRNIIPYKPRSIRARTLRRLSYNPIVIDSSSSSNDDSDFDHSIAHSECDIRTRMSATSRQRRQYLNRKSYSMRNGANSGRRVGINNDPKDKIYGSNSSIKSAPHYNYTNEKKDRLLSAGRYQGNGGQYFSYDNDYDEKLNEFVKSHASARNSFRGSNVIKPPKAFAMNGSNINTASNYTRESLYHEFDIHKLTGKSPTTNSVFQQKEAAKTRYAQMLKNSEKSKSLSNANNANNISTNIVPQQAFQWPEKIHASAIKQNDLIWRQQQQQASVATAAASAAITVASSGAQLSHFNNVKVKQAFSSDSSSSDTEEFEFRQDFVPRIPPSPAP